MDSIYTLQTLKNYATSNFCTVDVTEAEIMLKGQHRVLAYPKDHRLVGCKQDMLLPFVVYQDFLKTYQIENRIVLDWKGGLSLKHLPTSRTAFDMAAHNAALMKVGLAGVPQDTGGENMERVKGRQKMIKEYCVIGLSDKDKVQRIYAGCVAFTSKDISDGDETPTWPCFVNNVLHIDKEQLNAIYEAMNKPVDKVTSRQLSSFRENQGLTLEVMDVIKNEGEHVRDRDGPFYVVMWLSRTAGCLKAGLEFPLGKCNLVPSTGAGGREVIPLGLIGFGSVLFSVPTKHCLKAASKMRREFYMGYTLSRVLNVVIMTEALENPELAIYTCIKNTPAWVRETVSQSHMVFRTLVSLLRDIREKKLKKVTRKFCEAIEALAKATMPGGVDKVLAQEGASAYDMSRDKGSVSWTQEEAQGRKLAPVRAVRGPKGAAAKAAEMVKLLSEEVVTNGLAASADESEESESDGDDDDRYISKSQAEGWQADTEVLQSRGREFFSTN